MTKNANPLMGLHARVHRTHTTLHITTVAFIFSLLAIFSAGCKKIREESGIKAFCPIVISTNPVNAATGINISSKIAASFNKIMDSTTINSITFRVMEGGSPVAGVVTYSGVTATFSPTVLLKTSSKYTAFITTGAKDLAGNAMIENYVWSFTTGASTDVIAPTVISTDPFDTESGVILNKKIFAKFSEVMDSSSINTSTFLLKAGTTSITGKVSYAGNTAVFSPSVNLTANTSYTATITSGARDLGGNALANEYVWTFTTGASTDAIKPTVIATDPVNLAVNVALNKKITATFSEVMNAQTINSLTFSLKQGGIPIAGIVSYSGTTAVFSPSTSLMPNTLYTATITTGAEDLAGNSIVSDYTWSFTTSSTSPPTFLGSVALFGAFGGNAGITNSGLNTVINNGSIGTTAASTLITGFHDGTTGDIYTETPLNVGLVAGRIYTAPPFPGTATSFSIASQASLDATVAYNSISPASKPGGMDPGAGELGGLTLAPGIYKSASGTFKITNGDLTLDAMGDPNAQWIFQTAAGLTVGVAGPAGARSVKLINGALAKNVFWYIGSSAIINAAGGGVMTGTIISSAGIVFSTAGNAVQTVLNGRAISLVASVTMVNTTINVPN